MGTTPAPHAGRQSWLRCRCPHFGDGRAILQEMDTESHSSELRSAHRKPTQSFQCCSVSSLEGVSAVHGLPEAGRDGGYNDRRRYAATSGRHLRESASNSLASRQSFSCSAFSSSSAKPVRLSPFWGRLALRIHRRRRPRRGCTHYEYNPCTVRWPVKPKASAVHGLPEAGRDGGYNDSRRFAANSGRHLRRRVHCPVKATRRRPASALDCRRCAAISGRHSPSHRVRRG